MTKYIGIVLILVLPFPSLSQSNTRDSVAIEALNKKVSELSKEILETKSASTKMLIEAQRLHEEEQSNHNGWLFRFVTLWGVVGGIIGTGLGVIITRQRLKKFVITAIEKMLPPKIDLQINRILPDKASLAIQNMVKTSKADIEKKFKEYLDERKLIESSKILVINALDTEFPELFIQTLKSYDLDLEVKDNLENVLTIDKTEELTKTATLDKINLFDLVIIEDMEPASKWLDNKVEADSENEQNLIYFLQEVSERTAVLYYGPAQINRNKLAEINKIFPCEKGRKLDLVSFSNSPATLYQNIFNLLKIRKLKYPV